MKINQVIMASMVTLTVMGCASRPSAEERTKIREKEQAEQKAKEQAAEKACWAQVVSNETVGVTELRSFFGIEFGSKFPGTNDIVSCMNDKRDPSCKIFTTRRRLISQEDCATTIRTVRLTEDGRVCEVAIFYHFYTDALSRVDNRLERSAGDYNMTMYSDGYSSWGNVYRTAAPSPGIDTARKRCNAAWGEVRDILQEKYKKQLLMAPRSVGGFIISFTNGFLRIEGGEASISIIASDYKMLAQKEKETKKRKGVNAL